MTRRTRRWIAYAISAAIATALVAVPAAAYAGLTAFPVD